MRRVATNKKGEEATGNQIRVTVAKNKLAPPFQKAHFDIEFGRGISRAGELVDLGVSTEVLEKSGSWYSYKGERLGQGREKLKLLLEENDELANELDVAIRHRLFHAKQTPTPTISDQEAEDSAPEEVTVEEEEEEEAVIDDSIEPKE